MYVHGLYVSLILCLLFNDAKVIYIMYRRMLGWTMDWKTFGNKLLLPNGVKSSNFENRNEALSHVGWRFGPSRTVLPPG
jgi:hypothetical protein